MTTLAINNPIFSNLYGNPAINQLALEGLVRISNSNPGLNAVLSQAASREAGPVKIRLATAKELQEYGAGAFFKYDADEIRDTDGFMSVAIDPSWLTGPNANLASFGAARGNFAGIITHEFDHYLRVAAFRATDDLADPSKSFPNLTNEQRFEAYATGRMQVEVLGWYSSMKANQFARTGSANGVFSQGDLLALGDVERELYKLEGRGIQAGLAGDSLQNYMAENGAPILSKSQPYWGSYVSDYDRNMTSNGVNYQAVRDRVAYKLESPEDVVSWRETVGSSQQLTSVITYRNGNTQSTTENLDGSISEETRSSSGSLMSTVLSSTVNGAVQITVYGPSNQLQSTTLQQTFDDGSSLKTTTYPDGKQTFTSTVSGTPTGNFTEVTRTFTATGELISTVTTTRADTNDANSPTTQTVISKVNGQDLSVTYTLDANNTATVKSVDSINGVALTDPIAAAATLQSLGTSTFTLTPTSQLDPASQGTLAAALPGLQANLSIAAGGTGTGTPTGTSTGTSTSDPGTTQTTTTSVTTTDGVVIGFNGANQVTTVVVPTASPADNFVPVTVNSTCYYLSSWLRPYLLVCSTKRPLKIASNDDFERITA